MRLQFQTRSGRGAGLAGAMLLGLLAISAPAQTSLVAEIDGALARAAGFLTARQSEDGAWRSSHYGFFRDGAALTPLAANTVYFLGQGGPAAREAWQRGAGFLARLADEDPPLDYPVYTSAMASWCGVLGGRTPEGLRAQEAWLRRVRALRFGSELGWHSSDAAFGGWGYVVNPPRRTTDPGGGAGYQANLSATLFSLAALRSGGVPEQDPTVRDALFFLDRTQNLDATGGVTQAVFDDGGFCFSPDDDAGNKAGPAGADATGRLRFRSYGSATADGARALLLCGLPPDHPRVVAARRWLETHFRGGFHPGDFAADREVLRAAHDFYYAWTVAHAFHALKVRALPDGSDWAERLARDLLARQEPDGAWRNRFTDAREDDPLVATPFAAAALALCRRTLVYPPDFPRPVAHGL